MSFLASIREALASDLVPDSHPKEPTIQWWLHAEIRVRAQMPDHEVWASIDRLYIIKGKSFAAISYDRTMRRLVVVALSEDAKEERLVETLGEDETLRLLPKGMGEE